MLEISPDAILHMLQSQFHDIKVAKSLGLKTAWMERRHGQQVPNTDTDIPIYRAHSHCTPNDMKCVGALFILSCRRAVAAHRSIKTRRRPTGTPLH